VTITLDDTGSIMGGTAGIGLSTPGFSYTGVATYSLVLGNNPVSNKPF
jgi:hypothetical protein